MYNLEHNQKLIEAAGEISGSPLFEPSNLDWEEYLNLGAKRCYPRGSVIIHANHPVDCIYYLKHGVVKQSLVSADGVEKIVGLIKAGNIFGEAIFFHGYPAQCSNVAVEDALIYLFYREAIDRMIRLNPAVMTHFVRSMSLKIRMLTTQIDMLYSLDAKTKICKLLHLLAQQSRQKKIRLTHKEIAQLAGVHRVTVSNTLALLRGWEVIEHQSGGLEVINLPALADLAEGRGMPAGE